MALWNNFPYTNTHELNLDWVIDVMKQLWEEWNSYGTSVTADAVAGLTPQVTVEGDLKEGLTFHFTLVKGDQGVQGETGNGIDYCTFNNYQLTIHFTDGTDYTTPSLKGDTGSGLQILDVYPTLADLQTDHPTGSAGDAYLVGTSPNFTLYVWSTSSNMWLDGGALTNPSPSITTPLMDGQADTGSELAYARGDHVHPSDTNKQDVLTAGSGIDIDASNVISVNAPIPQPSNTNPLMDGDSPDSGSSSYYSRADHVHKVFSYVGMVIQSTLANASDIQNIYGSDTSWILLSSVILTSENVKGNGLTLGITEGTNTGGYSVNRNIYQSSYGQNAGNTTNTGAFSGNGSIGVANSTQLGVTPENSGIIVDTAVVYTWERTA